MNTSIENTAINPMMNETLINTWPLAGPEVAIKEVAIDSLDHGDLIRIYTEKREYRFLLTDPAALNGLLTGGQLGEELTLANLLSICDDKGFHLKEDIAAISKGMRLVFHIPAGKRNLVTSRITMLVLEKFNTDRKLRSIKYGEVVIGEYRDDLKNGLKEEEMRLTQEFKVA